MDVAAIDLEHMKRGDEMFRRRAGSPANSGDVVRDSGDRRRAEPFIGHFVWGLLSHFPTAGRRSSRSPLVLPVYIALICYGSRSQRLRRPGLRPRLVTQAKRLLPTA